MCRDTYRASCQHGIFTPVVLAVLLATPPTTVGSKEEQQSSPSLFLPSWHFFQSATTLEAIGQHGEARRAIDAALRLEPRNKEYKRIQKRICHTHHNITRWHQAHQLSITLKVALSHSFSTLVAVVA